MQKWEYAIVLRYLDRALELRMSDGQCQTFWPMLRMRMPTPPELESLPLLHNFFGWMGEQGWELVTGDESSYIFKRPRSGN